jgi:hypothetical protein
MCSFMELSRYSYELKSKAAIPAVQDFHINSSPASQHVESRKFDFERPTESQDRNLGKAILWLPEEFGPVDSRLDGSSA